MIAAAEQRVWESVIGSLDSLLSADAETVGVATSEGLLTRLTLLAHVRARLDAVEADTLTAVEAREAYRLDTAPTTRAWLRHRLRLDDRDTATRVNRAATLQALPKTAAALQSGEIAAGHVDALTRGRRRVGTPTLAAAEDTLLELARRASPEQVRVAVDRLVQIVDPAETATDRAERHRAARHLTVTPGFEGTWTVSGLLDPADGALVKAALDAFSTRTPLPDGSPDPRTKGQRAADALVQFAATALASGDAPTVGGIAPHVSLVLDLPTLRGELHARTGGHPAGSAAAAAALAASGFAALLGRSFGPGALDRLTCDSELTPILVNELGLPLAVGREARFTDRHQNKALWVRDGGCITPGCDSRNLQAHHILHWGRDHGPTDIAVMCLLCERCHHLVHDDNWTIEPDPLRPGLFQIRSPRGGPPTPATHAIDRNPGTTIPLPFGDGED